MDTSLGRDSSEMVCAETTFSTYLRRRQSMQKYMKINKTGNKAKLRQNNGDSGLGFDKLELSSVDREQCSEGGVPKPGENEQCQAPILTQHSGEPAVVSEDRITESVDQTVNTEVVSKSKTGRHFSSFY